MPKKKGSKSEFSRHRQAPPDEFVEGTLRNVPLSHTDYSGEKFDPDVDRAVVGVAKKGKKGPKGGKPWKIQTILRRKDPTERARIKAEKQAKRAREAEEKARKKRLKAEEKARKAREKAEEKQKKQEERARKKAAKKKRK